MAAWPRPPAVVGTVPACPLCFSSHLKSNRERVGGQISELEALEPGEVDGHTHTQLHTHTQPEAVHTEMVGD